jgi:hypothetical protein
LTRIKFKGPDAAMSASQVQASVALLKKYLPDMTYSEVKSDVTTNQKPPKIIIKGVRPEKFPMKTKGRRQSMNVEDQRVRPWGISTCPIVQNPWL